MSDPQSFSSQGAGHLPTRQGVPERQAAEQRSGKDTVAAPSSDRYEILEKAGEGGMGLVWKARDTRLGRLVAIKRIHPKLVKSAVFLSRFKREARTVAGLRHPNIVQMFDLDEDEDGLFQVMQWIEGQNLQQMLKSEGTLSVERAAAIIAPIAEALACAHDAGVIHRDIKPANIMIDPQGTSFLTDFGLVRIDAESETMLSAGGTLTNAILGTVEFMAPEQAADPRQASAASDQWSLAATLYQMLTGRTIRGLRESLIPQPLRSPLLTALEYEPDERFTDLREFAAALTAVEPGARTQSSEQSAPAAETSLPQTTEETDLAGLLKQIQSRVESTVAQAKHAISERQDYAEAVQLLESIPDHLQDQSRLDELRSQRDSVARLNTEIETRVREMRLEGLRDKVHELLELQPRRRKLLELLETLPPETPPLLVAPVDTKTEQESQKDWAEFLGRPVEWENSIGMKFRLIPPGEFLMGSPKDEQARSITEEQHRVRITRPFYCGIYPVTQGEYEAVMGGNPSHFQGDQSDVKKLDTSRFPVEGVSWQDAEDFLKKLLARSDEPGVKYRLLTEAEWEYACRAGTATPYWLGNELDGKQANCNGNWAYPNATTTGPYLRSTSVVGSCAANAFGLFDTHGNVWEWCSDWYRKLWYSQSPTENPVGPDSGSSRVVRGGSWNDVASSCRSACRSSSVPTFRSHCIGFRVLCEF